MRSLMSRLWAGFSKNPSYEHLLQTSRYQELTVDLGGLPFKIADGPSFYWSFREIFVDRIYSFHSRSTSPRILDCGANYGTSVVFFKELYPSAKILALEPDPQIFEVLEWNMMTRGLEDVDLKNVALSHSRSPVTWYHEGADAGRLHKIEGVSAQGRVSTIALEDILDEDVDFLKMDIEGEETDVICATQNLDRVQQLFIEYHSFSDRAQELDRLLRKLKETGFRYFIQTQFVSPRPLTEPEQQLGMDLQLNIFGLSERAVKLRPA